MKIINYLSDLVMPLVIIVIIIYGVIERNKVFDIFCNGAKEGIKIVYNIFPTLIGIFLAVGLLRSSGVVDSILNIIKPIVTMLGIPTEIMPLAILRPISGSAATAVATDIMKNYGVDSKIRINYIYYNGSNRNNIIYNCSLYFICWNKENKICINICSNCRCGSE